MTNATGVSLSRDGPVAIITIDRPHAKNALDSGATQGLKDAFERFDHDDSALVAVLYGANGTFCAGADLKEMADDTSYVAWAGSLDGMLGKPLSKPVIGAVEGHAVAGGLGVALYCDIRIASKSAVFGVFCRRFGVPMSDGTTVRLPRLIGQSKALHMMITGCPVSADEALRLGLAAEVVPTGEALARAVELAHDLSRLPQGALRSDRRSVIESAAMPLDDALRHEAALAEQAKREDAATGAALFRAGAGRHGKSETC